MLTPMNSSAAISLFERPCAARAATRGSVSVSSSSEVGSAPADPLELTAGLLSPQPRAQLLEDRERLLQRLPCGLLLPRLSPHHPEAEERAAALQWIGGELRERAVERGERRRRVALGRGKQPLAARGRRHCPGAGDAFRVPRVRVQVGAGVLEISDADQRLDRVRPDRGGRLVQPPREEPARQVAQKAPGGLEFAERELEPAEHTQARDREELVRHCPRARDACLRGEAGLLDETEVCLDQRHGAADHAGAVPILGLPFQLVGDGGMAESPLPATREPLELA